MGTKGTADRRDADSARIRPALATSRPTEPRLLLSGRLRQQTAVLHRQTEELLGLPGAIRTRHDYAIWLGRFLGLYEPVEQILAGFPEWNTFGIARPSLTVSPNAVMVGGGRPSTPFSRPALHAVDSAPPAFAGACFGTMTMSGQCQGADDSVMSRRPLCAAPADPQ
jgi:hypothetical protein